MDRLSRLRAYAAQDPGNDRLYFDLVDELLGHGLIEEAQTTLRGMPEASRQTQDYLWRNARCALSSNDFAAAIKLLEALPREGMDEAAICHDLAYAYLCDGQIIAAENALAPVLVHAVDVPAVGVLHARVLHHRGQLGDAITMGEAIVATHPENAEAWGVLALLHIDTLQIEPARRAADTALRLNAHQPDALTALGTLYLWSRDADAASQAFGSLLSLQPNAGRALAGAGESLMLKGDIADARALLSRAVVAMPNHIGTWHALAWCDLLQGDVAHARICFDKAYELDRNFGETHGGIGLIHALAGETEAARQAVKRALRLDPQSRNARYAQSLLWRQEGRRQEAAAMVDGILADAGLTTTIRPLDFIDQLHARMVPGKND